MYRNIDSKTMIIIACIGLVANLFSAFMLHRHTHDSINIQGAFLHVVMDMIGSIAVIISGIIISITGFTHIDLITSFLIATMILPKSFVLLRSSVDILLQKSPDNILDPDIIKEYLECLDGVESVHDLRIWTLDGEDSICSLHVVHKENNDDVIDEIKEYLYQIGIEDSTIQIENEK